jgi:hypothetical protein
MYEKINLIKSRNRFKTNFLSKNSLNFLFTKTNATKMAHEQRCFS